jgi:hypothetical protein
MSIRLKAFNRAMKPRGSFGISGSLYLTGEVTINFVTRGTKRELSIYKYSKVRNWKKLQKHAVGPKL